VVGADVGRVAQGGPRDADPPLGGQAVELRVACPLARLLVEADAAPGGPVDEQLAAGLHRGEGELDVGHVGPDQPGDLSPALVAAAVEGGPSQPFGDRIDLLADDVGQTQGVEPAGGRGEVDPLLVDDGGGGQPGGEVERPTHDARGAVEGVQV